MSANEILDQLIRLNQRITKTSIKTSHIQFVERSLSSLLDCQVQTHLIVRFHENKNIYYSELTQLQEILRVAIEHNKIAVSEKPEPTNDDIVLLSRVKGQVVRGEKTILSAAIKISDHKHLFGVWKITSLSGVGFTIEELEIFEIYTKFLSSIVLRLIHADHLKAINKISRSLASKLDLDDLIQVFLRLLKSKFGYDNVQFLYMNYLGGVTLYTVNSIQEDKLIYRDYVSGFPLNPLVKWVINHRKKLVINQRSQFRQLFPGEAFDESIRSEIALPIQLRGHIYGVIYIKSERLDDFEPVIASHLTYLAGQFAIILRNIEERRTGRWQHRLAESMRGIVGLLAADVEIKQVLNQIISEIKTNLPCDAAAIWIDGNAHTQTEQDNHIADLEVAALYINPELPHILDNPVDYLASEFDNPWLLAALNQTSPIIRNALDIQEPLGHLLSLPLDYSAIGAPLRLGDVCYGLLVLVHRNTGRYGDASKAVTETFASYAAVAIENKRLYDAAHQQAWVSTALLQVSEATQTSTSVQELVDLIVRIMPNLVGIKSCAVYVFDHLTDLFIPSATYGLFTEEDELTWKLNLQSSKNPVFEHLLNEKSPIILNELSIPNEQVNNFLPGLVFKDNLYAMFPMLAQNELEGCILVDLFGNHADRDEMDLIEDEMIAIIQGIAHQTANAIANIRLIESRDQETYVSVALLQVAQAVSNFEELKDALSAIVRITPILTGVKYCVIYLWDESTDLFHLSESYGLTRAELAALPEFCSSDQFPILSVIQHTNQVAIKPTDEKIYSPHSWQDITSAVFLKGLDWGNENDSSPVADELGELLQSSKPFFLGLPISARGKVLGIMLTQETDTQSGLPSPRLREKRLEIITGITQQAALAIDNDNLQKDKVKREMLERELQLAREIQITFLPDEIPFIDGYDIDIRWRPARQVGGDFYDLFPLPDGKLGIVIADVVDKGMPAALFMVLARTLIRAVAREEQSPARTLMQVNDLLLSDSKRGLFVTVTYAVISPLTGSIVYANAGHNPPLYYSIMENKLNSLQRTGMALGILPEIEIADGEIYLHPGDRFLLYTDGVTEAFSVQDQLYGVERLESVFSRTNQSESKNMLDEIENSVLDFTQGLPLSDDLTLIGLIRGH